MPPGIFAMSAKGNVFWLPASILLSRLPVPRINNQLLMTDHCPQDSGLRGFATSARQLAGQVVTAHCLSRRVASDIRLQRRNRVCFSQTSVHLPHMLEFSRNKYGGQYGMMPRP